MLLSQKEALALAFPMKGTKVERRTAYLSEEERRRAQELARAKVESRLWTYYVGSSSSGPAGYAYFETHTVRTETETMMTVLDPSGRIRFVEILAFAEPDEFRADARWLAQFKGRAEPASLFLGRDLRTRAGATLTSQALAEGARRALAVHQVLREGHEGAP